MELFQVDITNVFALFQRKNVKIFFGIHLIICVVTKLRIIFLFSGNTVIGKSSGAMSFLIDSVIQENSNKKIILDFEGSNDLGLARYYSSFGSIEHVYLHLKKNTLPFPVRLFKR